MKSAKIKTKIKDLKREINSVRERGFDLFLVFIISNFIALPFYIRLGEVLNLNIDKLLVLAVLTTFILFILINLIISLLSEVQVSIYDQAIIEYQILNGELERRKTVFNILLILMLFFTLFILILCLMVHLDKGLNDFI